MISMILMKLARTLLGSTMVDIRQNEAAATGDYTTPQLCISNAYLIVFELMASNKLWLGFIYD